VAELMEMFKGTAQEKTSRKLDRIRSEYAHAPDDLQVIGEETLRDLSERRV
jgi:hypothetical protein